MAFASSDGLPMNDPGRTPLWKPPTIREIADLAGVGAATVDRVLNNRTGVREKTRRRVLGALDKLCRERNDDAAPLDIRLFCDSGETFNGAMAKAVGEVNRSTPGAVATGTYITTNLFDPELFSRRIEDDGSHADGVIVVGREHPGMNRAVRKLQVQGIPVVCLTTDLPSSRHGANVGNDRAIEDSGMAEKTIFVGHELTSHSRALVEAGTMDYVISHDFAAELEQAVCWIRENRNGVVADPEHSQILIHTRYHCGA
jgi:ABC-type sugar transport system substrate-binding protein